MKKLFDLKTPQPVIKQKVIKESKTLQETSNNIKNTELFEGIKEIFNNNKETEKRKIYFTPSKGKISYNIDDSIFMPSKLTLLQSKNFNEAYIKQLESYIYTNKENIDEDKLLSIIYIFSLLNKNKYPIRIVTSKYKKLSSRICGCLNDFFNKNYLVIHSIYTMFSSFKDAEEETNASKTVHL